MRSLNKCHLRDRTPSVLLRFDIRFFYRFHIVFRFGFDLRRKETRWICKWRLRKPAEVSSTSYLPGCWHGKEWHWGDPHHGGGVILLYNLSVKEKLGNRDNLWQYKLSLKGLLQRLNRKKNDCIKEYLYGEETIKYTISRKDYSYKTIPAPSVTDP